MILRNIQPQTKLPFSGVVLPNIDISDAQRAAVGAKPGCNNAEFLKQLCRVGFKDKLKHLSPEQRKAYGERVTFELDMIEFLGFTNYIVMVWDICRFADDSSIPRGPGRGSVGSSLVSYLTGITNLDPIEHGLFFSRFLSKARAKKTVIDGVTYIDGGLVPDIDCDFSFYRRSEILAYLHSRYPGQTSKLLTTTTFSSKILLKDVLKTFEGGTEDQANEVSGLVEVEFGIPQEIEDALSDNEDKQNVRLKEWAESHPETAEIAMGLSALNRGEGQHASALIITHGKINELMPLQLSSDKELVTGFDMYSAQEISIKMDILGLRTLDVVHDACKLIGIDRDKIDVHNPSIYAYLQDFRYRYGVFQLETFAQGNAAAKIAPKDFEQLSALLAIARPGAFAYLDTYNNYLKTGEFKSVHPLIDDILRPTGGVCLFQEQYLAMLVKVGMTAEEAEGARKVLGKKLVDKVPEVKAKIAEVCAKNSHPPEIVDLLLKIAEESGGYSFNKSHSACYAIIVAWTLYLKANYPIQFYWALLRMAKNESDGHTVIAQIEKEMRSRGFTLLPPHLVKSSIDFTIVDDKSIRFGLSMIRGVSDKSVSKLDAFRIDVAKSGEDFKKTVSKFQIFQAIKNAGLNIGIGSALIQAGCIEGYGESRSRLVLELCTWNLLTDKEKALCITLADKPEINHDVLRAIAYLRDNKDEKGKPLFVRATRFGTIKKKYEKYKEIWEMNRRNERLANYFYERTILGYSYSETLRDIFGEAVDGLVSVADVEVAKQDDKVRMIGFVKEPVKSKTKAGNDGFRFIIADETGEITIRFFNQTIDQVFVANGRLPIEGDLVICKATKKEGSCAFANEIGIQTAKIYMKLSELKEAGEKAETGLATSPTETVSAPAA